MLLLLIIILFTYFYFYDDYHYFTIIEGGIRDLAATSETWGHKWALGRLGGHLHDMRYGCVIGKTLQNRGRTGRRYNQY
jgi:hypothetical protein